ncbi:MAG: OmpH family outer membrane protein [Flavobacteriales bacterium]
MTKRDYIFSAVLGLVVVAVAAMYLNQPKVAYVHVEKILDNFKGTKDGVEEFQKKDLQRKLSLDSLQKLVIEGDKQLKDPATKLSKTEKENLLISIRFNAQKLNELQKTLSEESAAEEEKISQAVLTQIQQYIEDYAKENNYSMIFGTEGEGNILYAEEGIDISDAIVEGLNSKYQSAK